MLYSLLVILYTYFYLVCCYFYCCGFCMPFPLLRERHTKSTTSLLEGKSAGAIHKWLVILMERLHLCKDKKEMVQT